MLPLLVEPQPTPSQKRYLQTHFQHLCQALAIPTPKQEAFWQFLTQNYQQADRHYHNLTHLHNMLQLFDQYQTDIQQPLVFQLAIWWHDVIYNAKRKDNEKKSAESAQQMLAAFLSEIQMQTLTELILSTEKHQPLNEHPDTQLFLDVDLAILAADRATYQKYSQAIWKEYKKAYLKILYKMGRKKALKHFLQQTNIFYTPLFRQKYEAQARQNIQEEIINL